MVQGVGKTSILLKFTSDRFEEKTNNFEEPIRRQVHLDGADVPLLIEDTAGQERYRYPSRGSRA